MYGDGGGDTISYLLDPPVLEFHGNMVVVLLLFLLRSRERTTETNNSYKRSSDDNESHGSYTVFRHW